MFFPKNSKDINLILILAAVYILTRLPLLFYLPFIQDEAVYAIMIEEQIQNPTSIPTFLGYPVSWKPPLFFWTYSVLSDLPLPLEAAYRFPSFIFGLLSLFPLFYLLRNVGCSKSIAFFSLLIFLFSYVAAYPQTTLLTDSLLFFLICSSLYLYSEKKFGDWCFLAAGVVAFLAFFVKTVVALMIPLLALSLLYAYQREKLRNLLFIISLLAIPLAFFAHFMLLDSVGLAEELYFSEMKGHVVNEGGPMGQLGLLVGSLVLFLPGAGIWFALSLVGLWNNWKENLFMSFWYLMMVFPILFGYFMPWYYLPVMPALAYFSALVLVKWENKEKIDAFFWIFLSGALLLSLLLSSMLYVFTADQFIAQKEAGLLLTGKENVLIIGQYAPAIPAYKVLTERESGESLDFGWVLGHRNFSNEEAFDYVEDYNTEKYDVIDGSFSSIFTRHDINFRKDTDLTEFDYVVAIEQDGFNLPFAEPIYNNSDIVIFKVD